MDVRFAILGVVLGFGDVVGASAPAAVADGVEDVAGEPQADDARAIFDTLVERYRALVDYEDTIAVVETVTRDSQEPHRVVTRLACRIENDRLRIDSPGAQVRDGIAPATSVARSDAMESLALRYNLWIAPHLALRLKEDPLAEFRLGVPQGFVVAAAEPAAWRERQRMKLVLEAEAVEDAAADDEKAARYELWVNPESMLIERVTGRQTLPDGADYRLVMEITVIRTNGAQVAGAE